MDDNNQGSYEFQYSLKQVEYLQRMAESHTIGQTLQMALTDKIIEPHVSCIVGFWVDMVAEMRSGVNKVQEFHDDTANYVKQMERVSVKK